ncbi:MAG: DUF2281 domain-containing protein [Deltaproteobacteria bacterium]|nr:DUF2281 domain-containing protein [Deltaproteobacteria bacterium]
MATAKSLGRIIQELPEELRNEVEDFAYYLWERRVSNGKQLKEFDFDRLIGMGLLAPLNPNPQFKNEDKLWE